MKEPLHVFTSAVCVYVCCRVTFSNKRLSDPALAQPGFLMAPHALTRDVPEKREHQDFLGSLGVVYIIRIKREREREKPIISPLLYIICILLLYNSCLLLLFLFGVYLVRLYFYFDQTLYCCYERSFKWFPLYSIFLCVCVWQQRKGKRNIIRSRIEQHGREQFYAGYILILYRCVCVQLRTYIKKSGVFSRPVLNNANADACVRATVAVPALVVVVQQLSSTTEKQPVQSQCSI